MHLPSEVWQTPVLHASSSPWQLTPAPAVQTPFWQLSPSVQLSLSALQLVPFAFGCLTQAPSLARQAPSLQMSPAAEQSFGVPWHAPSWQTSSLVHGSPSSQLVPLALAGLVHLPVVGSQTPASWHWSCAVQTIVASLTHRPFSHARQPPQLLPWQAHCPSAWQSRPSPQVSPTWSGSGSQVVVVSLHRWQAGQAGLHLQEPQSTVCWQLFWTEPHVSAQVSANDSGSHSGALPLPLPLLPGR
jgi:hypothetical protein